MGTILYLLALLALTLGLVWFLETRWKRRNPVTPDIATTTCTPGKTTIRMERDGRVVAVLVLRQINWSYNGPTTAEFTDLTHFMTERQR